MSVNRIVKWFAAAFPQPQPRNLNTQIGVHIEEFAEMLSTISSENAESAARIAELTAVVEDLATDIKAGRVQIKITDRTELLDSLCDQVVTATGIAHLAGMNMESALEEVAASNDSKFDEAGLPIYNADGKVMKGPNYFRPELAKFTGPSPEEATPSVTG